MACRPSLVLATLAGQVLSAKITPAMSFYQPEKRESVWSYSPQFAKSHSALVGCKISKALISVAIDLMVLCLTHL
ncbi:hypothetical protein SADUNF_Sadunf18G0047000 [Salix dunnii]|uniref:Secreted protein n=1 Tax=Salix dunnii TaxID=1413687 RepID=A0A835MM18_9ROSI|nr:hypothetical protein SADUNF_Sadunf18G0047000 [Salix dunnii]